MSDVCIRLAQLSDRDQLVRLREALWHKSSAEELTRELTPAATAADTMPRRHKLSRRVGRPYSRSARATTS